MFRKQLNCIAFAALSLFQISFGDACNCWKTKENGLVFTNYKTLDFRSLAKYAGPVPPIINGYNANAQAKATSAYFKSSAWTKFFSLQTWGDTGSPVKMINSPNNAYIQKNTDGSTYLTLRTYRTKSFQSVVEADSVADDYTAASLRILSRVHGSPGACAGAFTYKSDDHTGVQHESDIEVLTQNSKNIIHYTTHPESENHDFDGTFSIAAKDSSGWNKWQEHRLDWTQPHSTWYLNGKQNGQLSHELAQVPSYLILNMWSRGDSDWEGTMAVGGSAYYDVQYIQVAYNTSTESSRACTSTCTLP
ncbi:putative GH16 domain-containing protein [Seiridium cardinale]